MSRCQGASRSDATPMLPCAQLQEEAACVSSKVPAVSGASTASSTAQGRHGCDRASEHSEKMRPLAGAPRSAASVMTAWPCQRAEAARGPDAATIISGVGRTTVIDDLARRLTEGLAGVHYRVRRAVIVRRAPQGFQAAGQRSCNRD
jgi:hypothetical protein